MEQVNNFWTRNVPTDSPGAYDLNLRLVRRGVACVHLPPGPINDVDVESVTIIQVHSISQ